MKTDRSVPFLGSHALAQSCCLNIHNPARKYFHKKHMHRIVSIAITKQHLWYYFVKPYKHLKHVNNYIWGLKLVNFISFKSPKCMATWPLTSNVCHSHLGKWCLISPPQISNTGNLVFSAQRQEVFCATHYQPVCLLGTEWPVSIQSSPSWSEAW